LEKASNTENSWNDLRWHAQRCEHRICNFRQQYTASRRW